MAADPQFKFWKDKLVTVVSMTSNSGRAHRFVRKWVGRSGTVIGISVNNMLLIEFATRGETSKPIRSIPAGCVIENEKLQWAGSPRPKKEKPIDLRAMTPQERKDHILRDGQRRMQEAKAAFDKAMQECEDPLDEDGYPSEQALKVIELWPLWEPGAGRACFDFIKSIWHLKSWGWHEGDAPDDLHKDKMVYTYEISTAGWSGNESIIAAMQRNWLLWSCHWVQSRRGGHYTFEIKHSDE